MLQLLKEIRTCVLCPLPHGHRPVMAAHPKSKIVIIGQAPGRKVHESGVPWDDKSGDNLRKWLGVTHEQFYDPALFAILPMGFCYPGTGKSGDLPPRPECAPQWHSKVLDHLKETELTLLIGQYAQEYYLQKSEQSLTETVKNYKAYLPNYFVLPHPSPRNNIWMKKNPWFGDNVLPALKNRISAALP
uniref:uracil-DNA glycosylase family protein n=1 Tax=Fulvivirga sp. TaxID=1931237 RepID=UPI00404AD86C